MRNIAAGLSDGRARVKRDGHRRRKSASAAVTRGCVKSSAPTHGKRRALRGRRKWETMIPSLGIHSDGSKRASVPRLRWGWGIGKASRIAQGLSPPRDTEST